MFAVGAGPRPARRDFKYALVKRRGDPCGRPCRMQNQVSIPFVGAAHRAVRPKWIGGRPLDLPHPIPEDFLRTVGEGLKVNRPKAERSHSGVCPSRRSKIRRAGQCPAPTERKGLLLHPP